MIAAQTLVFVQSAALLSAAGWSIQQAVDYATTHGPFAPGSSDYTHHHQVPALLGLAGGTIVIAALLGVAAALLNAARRGPRLALLVLEAVIVMAAFYGGGFVAIASLLAIASCIAVVALMSTATPAYAD
ncbi:MAG: hypothetical protein QOG80_3581 [Pseudonocardiales bacterium]|nr:hypothetical protein [Pseudonocardiales bacterium]